MRYKFARSNVPGKAPTLEQLPANEIAVNTADKVVYFSTGTNIIKIAGYTVHNASYAIDFSGAFPVITTVAAFIPNSTRLYIGGQRQMLGNDYTESSSNTLTLAVSLSEEAFNTGGNTIVLDYDLA